MAYACRSRALSCVRCSRWRWTHPEVADPTGDPRGHRMRLTGACVAEASSPRPTSVACLHSSHVRTTGWHALLRSRASRWPFVSRNVAFRRRHVALTSSSAFSGNRRYIASPITSSFVHWSAGEKAYGGPSPPSPADSTFTSMSVSGSTRA